MTSLRRATLYSRKRSGNHWIGRTKPTQTSCNTLPTTGSTTKLSSTKIVGLTARVLKLTRRTVRGHVRLCHEVTIGDWLCSPALLETATRTTGPFGRSPPPPPPSTPSLRVTPRWRCLRQYSTTTSGTRNTATIFPATTTPKLTARAEKIFPSAGGRWRTRDGN